MVVARVADPADVAANLCLSAPRALLHSRADSQPTEPRFVRVGLMTQFPRSRYLLFAVPASVGFAADLVTKAWVFSVPELRAGDIYWVWTGHVGVQLSRNWGALFG